MAQEEVKPDLASLVAEIAREECEKLYGKRLRGLEEERSLGSFLTILNGESGLLSVQEWQSQSHQE